jgi:hypothetical protein
MRLTDGRGRCPHLGARRRCGRPGGTPWMAGSSGWRPSP